MRNCTWIILLLPLCAYAAEPRIPSDGTHRLEAKASYDYLRPNAVYGDFKALSLSYFDSATKSLTWFAGTEIHTRSAMGDALSGVVGAYKDWTSSMYTYTDVSAGTDSQYLPRFRADHDFNIKIARRKNVVLCLGATYIDYWDAHEDTIFSAGTVLYFPYAVLECRLFQNYSDPGRYASNSALLSVGIGKEKSQWTYLTFSTGDQAYLATYVAPAQSVHNDTFSIALKHRHWLEHNYGIILESQYVNIKNGYEQYGILLGMFREF